MTDKQKQEAKHRQDIHQLITDLVRIKYEAGRLGLYGTMHLIDEATTRVGYEAAEIFERYDKEAK